MKKLFSFFQRKLPLLLILAVGLVPLRWFKNNLLIAGGDLPIPLDPAAGKFIGSFLYTWYPYLYGGEVNPHQFAIFPWFGFWALLKSLGSSLLLINKLWFIFVFTLSGVSMYYLVSVVFKKANPVLLFVAPLFYMFNVYVVVMTPIVATPLLYGALPLILGLYIKGLDERENSSRYAVLVALSSLLICAAIGNPPIYAILGIMLFTYYLFYLVTNPRKDVVFSLIFIFKIGIWYFLLNLWWFYPFLINVLFHSGDLAEAVVSSGFGRSFLLENFRLLGSWAFFSGSLGSDYFPFAHYYKNPSLIILTFPIPLMAFVSTFFKPKSKTLYFLIMAVLGILLANGSGSAAPINNLLFRLPGFWIFREPFSKFTAITAISFAILIGFSTSNIFDFIKKHKGSNLARFYLIGVVLVILISSWPILTGDLIFSQRGWMKSSHVEIPDYWFKTGNWFNNQKGDFRILVLPKNPEGYYCGLNYKWGYGSADIVPYLIHQPLIEERAGLGASVGIKLSTTLANAIYDKILNFKTGSLDVKTLLQVLNIRYILQRNDVEWELISPDDPFLFSPTHLQRALSSEKYLFKDKSLGNLDFYGLSEESFLPHLYIPQKIVYSHGDIESLPEIISFGDYQIRSAIFLADNADKSTEDTEKARRTLKSRADEVFVKAELKNAVTEEELGMTVKPEEISLPYVRQKPGSLFYSLVLKKEQFYKWKVRKNPEKLFEKHLFYASKRVSEIMAFGVNEPILANYKKEMTDALGILKKLKQEGSKDFVKLLAKYEGTLWGQREKIKEIESLTDWDNTFKELEGQAEELKIKRDFSKLAYNFEIPKSGNYSLFIKDINGLTDYSLLVERNFEEGEQELVLPFSGISGNLVDENLRIKDYSPNSIYRISFEYQAPRGGSFFVAEGKTGETAETQLSPTGDEFRNFERFFKSSSDVQEAAVHLSMSVSEEKNLRIERIYQPELMLRMDAENADGERRARITPKITFVKINPTKYRVKIEGAVDPYTLVFSESFHQGWKAYINQYQISNIKYQKDYGEIVASYFEGEIKEGTHRNIFLDRNTFETWGKKPIAEERHYLVNGYANSWYITPEDAGGKQDYELIIEFAPQRLFYKGLFISGITLAGCLIYLLYNSIIVRRNRQ